MSVYIVRSKDEYATIGFSFMTSSFRQLAKPYRSRWRARFRAWRLNREESDYLRSITDPVRYWVEKVE